MSNIFKKANGIIPGRSTFDLSYEKKFDCDMGELIPIMCDEVVPGDFFKVGNELVLRFQPLVAPILHEINAYVHYFFVPTRLLWDSWDDFITGGKNGDDSSVLPRFFATGSPDYGKYSLWDYFGFPPGVLPGATELSPYRPLSFPWRAYNLIYNEYYRDENLQDEVSLNQKYVLHRAWEKDYFTSSLPWQQRGTAPALPISGITSAVFPSDSLSISFSGDSTPTSSQEKLVGGVVSGVNGLHFSSSSSLINGGFSGLNNNTVDLSNATTFNVSDLRLAFQIQKWLERNARGGVRYTEFLRSHFGVSPRDDRLQRPEYLGGSKSPIIISEVLQTSGSNITGQSTPQGNLSGHGLTADKNSCFSYHAKEFGYILGILSVMPKPSYQQGINKQWLRYTKYDFYFPEFSHLSEQAVTEEEIYAVNGENSPNGTIFGYQGRYNEMRYKPNQVCGGLRDTFAYWHLGRQFSSPPNLNSSFITCVPRKDIFVSQNEKGLIVNFANIIYASRPMPYISDPGLIDHN